MTDSRRLAVLIDADNVSSKVSTDLFAELAGYGLLTVKRAYGDWTTDQLNGWKKRLHEHAISPMQQFAYTTGKNSSDSALIIDAMDLLYAGNLDGFVIVSSDSDFTRLATRLRESAMTVYGVGASKTPRAFRDACDKFTFLEVLQAGGTVEEDEPAPRGRRGQRGGGSDAPAEATQEPREEADVVELGSRESAAALQSVLSRSLNKADSDDEDWTAVSSLGSLLIRVDPSFDARTYGFARLSDLIREQPFLETRTVTTAAGQEQLMARLKGRRGGGRGGRRGKADRPDGRADGRADGRNESRAEDLPDRTPEPVAEDATARRTAQAPGVEAAAAPQPTTPPEPTPAREAERPVQPETVPEPAPTADAPVVEPAGDQPAADGPTVGQPAVDEPVADEPAPRKRAAAKRTTKAAATKAPAKKAAKKATAEGATTEESDAAPATNASARKSTSKTTGKTTGKTTRKTASKKAAAVQPEPPAEVDAPAAADEAPAEKAPLTVTTRRVPRRAAKRAAGPSVPTE